MEKGNAGELRREEIFTEGNKGNEGEKSHGRQYPIECGLPGGTRALASGNVRQAAIRKMKSRIRRSTVSKGAESPGPSRGGDIRPSAASYGGTRALASGNVKQAAIRKMQSGISRNAAPKGPEGPGLFSPMNVKQTSTQKTPIKP
jgi:hypothetical protein